MEEFITLLTNSIFGGLVFGTVFLGMTKLKQVEGQSPLFTFGYASLFGSILSAVQTIGEILAQRQMGDSITNINLEGLAAAQQINTITNILLLIILAGMIFTTTKLYERQTLLSSFMLILFPSIVFELVSGIITAIILSLS